MNHKAHRNFPVQRLLSENWLVILYILTIIGTAVLTIND